MPTVNSLGSMEVYKAFRDVGWPDDLALEVCENPNEPYVHKLWLEFIGPFPTYERQGFKKKPISQATRRAVALKYGCEPGEALVAVCFYCGAEGHITWFRHYGGKVSAWVHFGGLELDHLHPESKGGTDDPDNIVLACARCNRSKGSKSVEEFMAARRARSGPS